MGTIRAKFYVSKKTPVIYGPNKVSKIGEVTLWPVPYDSNNPNSENSAFWAASPSGEIRMNIQNESAYEAFELGKTYYIDFTEAE